MVIVGIVLILAAAVGFLATWLWLGYATAPKVTSWNVYGDGWLGIIYADGTHASAGDWLRSDPSDSAGA